MTDWPKSNSSPAYLYKHLQNAIQYIKSGSTYVYFNCKPNFEQEHDGCLFQGSTHECIDGKTILQRFPKSLVGQKVTLELDGKNSILSYDRLATLKTWRDAPDSYPIAFYDGITLIDASFDYSQAAPIDVRYLDGNQVMVIGTIHLIRV